jgi:Sulfotransferase family
MKDRLWQAVYKALRPLLSEADTVLAPRGDWPAFPCACTLYDAVIDIGDATVFVLHKGRLTGIRKGDLRRIAREWQWIFANEVFVVFSRMGKIRRDVRLSLEIIHCWPVIRYLRSASFRKRRSRIVYVHVPKTGGTSMWVSLARAFPSHAYYGSSYACLKNPPAPDDYDLIGLHFSPTVLSEFLSEDDWVVGMVRHPTERFLSGVVHCRRQSEDPETFTPSMRAMRDMDLADYLATEFGRFESRLQLITFGTDYRQPADALSDQEMLSSALAFAQRKNVILAPSERSREFRNFLARRLSFRPRALGRLNANEPAMHTAYPPDFYGAIGLIDSITACEREFYDSVRQSFSELLASSQPTHKFFFAERLAGIGSRLSSRLVSDGAARPH